MMEKANLTHKIHNAVVGHDLLEIVDVLKCVLAIAICEEFEDQEDRLEKIVDVHGYLLGKIMRRRRQ